MATDNKEQTQLSDIEHIKSGSNYLRGNIVTDLNDPITAGVTEESKQLLKFHGMYLQDYREVRQERRKQKLESYYNFMMRVRAPGGIVTPEQWLVLDELAHKYANGTLRLTTRQSFQFHGILKQDLKPTISALHETMMDTIAACGDVNRNVMCNPNPHQSAVHAEAYELSKKLSEHLTPQTHSYYEIWMDKEQVSSNKEEEPVYGKTYLPRKFKIAIAVPPGNDVDVFAHDLGLIAIVKDNKVTGYNVSVGGGMGMTHNEPDTYPRLAEVIGFCRPEQVPDVADKVVAIQRDHGDRVNRKHARLKYTIEDRGIAWFKATLHSQLGWKLEPAQKFHFEHNHDRYGWVKGTNGKWHYTLFVENGRIKDSDQHQMMSGLREIAKIHKGDFRLTPNQNLIIGQVSQTQKPKIRELIDAFKLDTGKHYTKLRLNAMACVALPTCGLAMAESERYLPELISKIEAIMKEAGLSEDAIVVRMTGCPNGCARPYLGEIGFVGKAEGSYNMYLGAGFAGDRLNKLYKENVTESEILKALTPIIHHYAKERGDGEPFGDFVIRQGYVDEVKAGRAFHTL